MAKLGQASKHVCASCGASYNDLAAHLRWHPECDDEDYPELVATSECSDFDYILDLEPDSTLAALASDDLRDRVASDLAELRLEHGYGDKDIERLKGMVQTWVAMRDRSSHRNLAPLLRKDAKPEKVAAALGQRCIFEGIETSKRELAHTKSDVPYLEPREVQLSDDPNDKVVSFDICDLIARKLQHDSNFRKKAEACSDVLKSGAKYQTSPDGALENTLDGDEARFHPHLWRPAEADEEFDLRVPLQFQCDEVEVTSARRPPARLPAPQPDA